MQYTLSMNPYTALVQVTEVSELTSRQEYEEINHSTPVLSNQKAHKIRWRLDSRESLESAKERDRWRSAHAREIERGAGATSAQSIRIGADR